MEKEVNFKVGDNIITSKGRFGKIELIKGVRADVKIGENIVELKLYQLIKVSGAKAIEVEFKLDIYGDVMKDILYISDRIILFDRDRPMENEVLNKCVELLCKKNSIKKVIILKLNLV
jgi:hypothetical protein